MLCESGDRRKPRWQREDLRFDHSTFLFKLQFGLVEAFPLTFLQVNATVGQKGDSFILKQAALHIGAAEGKAAREAAVFKHHAVAGDDAGFGVGVQSISHEPCGARVPGQQCNLPVVGHLAAGNGLHHPIELPKQAL